MFLRLACKSLLDRKGSVLLALTAISVSIFVLLGVEHVRHQARESFSNTVSGVDLIVGARTSSINLLLYSVFRIGNPTNNIRWETYQDIATSPHVDWAIPISLGDSHKGHRVMGTSADYFRHFSYGKQRTLRFSAGQEFAGLFDVVLGSSVARKLGYSVGDQLILAHGMSSTSFSMHDDKPFTVVGILAPTGTPVDQTLHVSLAGIEAIHIDWQQGVRIPGKGVSAETLATRDLSPDNITAFMLGLKSKMMTFRVRAELNNYTGEPLLAIIPGVSLSELWQMMSVMENVLRLVSVLVLGAALLGLSAMLLASIRERDQEINIMRTIGASPWFLFLLIEAEALLITLLATLLALVTLVATITLLGDRLTDQFGIHISTNILSGGNLYFIAFIFLSCLLASTIPAITAYYRASFRTR